MNQDIALLSLGKNKITIQTSVASYKIKWKNRFFTRSKLASQTDQNLEQQVSIAERHNGQSGNTLLHQLLLDCNNSTIDCLLREITTDKTLQNMTRMVNNKGKLPIDLIYQLNLSSENKKILYVILKIFTAMNTLGNLSDPLQKEKILNNYNYPQDSEPYNNLKIACDILNITRTQILYSDTHPQINNCTTQEKKFIFDLIDKIRLMEDEESRAHTLIKQLVRSFNFSYDTYGTLLEGQTNLPLALKYKAGNCGEIARLAYQTLRKLHPGMHGELYTIENGDHSFLVIGKNDASKVICDPWSGKVFFLHEAPRELNNYRRIYITDDYLNITTSYNPNFHAIKPLFSPEAVYFAKLNAMLNLLLGVSAGLALTLALICIAAFIYKTADSPTFSL